MAQALASAHPLMTSYAAELFHRLELAQLTTAYSRESTCFRIEANYDSGMGDNEDLLEAGAEAFFKPFSNLLEKLAGPLAKELGLTFGDAARVFRYGRAVKLFQKVERIAAESGFEPSAVRPKVLLPILNHASVEDDECMHDRWAALLANACNPSRKFEIRPSFPEILAQVSSEEATLLDSIQQHVARNLTEKHPDVPNAANWAYLVDVGTWKTILRLFANLQLSQLPASVLLDFQRNGKSPEATVDYANFRVALDNLIRLGLLREDQTKSHARPLVHITALGFDFVLACRPPHSRTQ